MATVRVLGPYANRGGKRWIVFVVDDEGKKHPQYCATEDEGHDLARELRKEISREEQTIEATLDTYERHLFAKGNKPGSIKTTLHRLRAFFGVELSAPLRDLTERRIKALYKALVGRQKADTHRNALAEVKTFLDWCVKSRLLPTNPATRVEGEGRRQKGKPQLRLDEARRFTAHALFLADKGEAGAVAALMTLLMGLRASEITGRRVRDLDDGGALLWVEDAKTAAGERRLEVPAVLRPYLQKLARGRSSDDLLFGKHWRDWPREWAQRICKQVGVPRVTAHGLRGLHATLAEENGITSHVVARALGHESATTTHEHYTQPGAVQKARTMRVLQVLSGGKNG